MSEPNQLPTDAQTVTAPVIEPVQNPDALNPNAPADMNAAPPSGEVQQVKQADSTVVSAIERGRAALNDAIERLRAKRPDASLASAEAAARVNPTGATPDDAAAMLNEVAKAESDVSARDIGATVTDGALAMAGASNIPSISGGEQVSGEAYFSALSNGLGGMMSVEKMMQKAKGGGIENA